MGATLKSTPQSLTAALKILGTKDKTVIGHNTHLVRSSDGTVYATYHGNNIAHYKQDGLYASWAGWGTSTTTTRLNQLFTARFNIRKGEGYIDGEETGLSDWTKIS